MTVKNIHKTIESKPPDSIQWVFNNFQNFFKLTFIQTIDLPILNDSLKLNNKNLENLRNRVNKTMGLG